MTHNIHNNILRNDMHTFLIFTCLFFIHFLVHTRRIQSIIIEPRLWLTIVIWLQTKSTFQSSASFLPTKIYILDTWWLKCSFFYLKGYFIYIPLPPILNKKAISILVTWLYTKKFITEFQKYIDTKNFWEYK